MTAPAPATAHSSWADVPFGEFLQLLRRNGFAVGLQHYARMMTLLDNLGPECSPVRVRSMLAPVFATTPDQQDRFYRLFDQWFPVFVSATTGELRPVGPGSAGADAAMPAPGSRRGVRQPQKLLPILAGVAAAALLAMLSWWAMRGAPVAPPPVDVTAPTPAAPAGPLPAPQTTPVPLPSAEPTSPAREVNWRAVRLTVALLIVLGFVLNEWRHYRRRRMIVERQRRERPPLVWPIKVDAASTPLVESSEFLTAARRLRERQTGDRERLDIEATIAATIRALGRPVLHYVKETRPPEYLILIERASTRDHQARLFQHLIEHLAAEGVHATVYWCEEDPRICDPVIEGPTATLMELRHRFPGHRLLMFGSGDGLIDPISGRRKAWVADALSWPDRALLTPESPESWGARELALAAHMIVLPGTLGGLQAAIDHFQIPSRRDLMARRHRTTRVPEPIPKDVVRAIKGYLGPRGLQWVCACAVYPDLQWNLTLLLGMMPEVGGAIDESMLVKLVRLPWFRQGAIPDDARAVLLRVIEPDVERAARRTIISLLERNPAPPESIASSRFELDLVVQKFALNSRARGTRRDLARVARNTPRDRVLSELAVLRLTEGDPTSTVAMRLPERLRDMFFQGGVSVLGLTSGARSVVAMALIAGVLFVGPGRALPTAEPEVEVAQDSSPATPLASTEIATGTDSTPAIRTDSTPTETEPPAAGVGPVIAANRPSDSGLANPSATRAPVDTAGQRVRAEPADVPPQPVTSDPQFGVVRLGTQMADASLFIGGTPNGSLGAVRSVRVPPAVPVELSIRTAGCERWDTTVTVAANDTVTIGLRAASPCAPAAPDPGMAARLIDEARAIATASLAGIWTGLDKAPVSFQTAQQQQRFASVLREFQPVRGSVPVLQARGAPETAVTQDSVFLSGTMRFEWRGGFGATERRDATIAVAFERTDAGLQLRRVLMSIRLP